MMQYNDLTARLMSEVEPELLDFVLTKVNSFVKWNLLRFFHANPHTADTVTNVARYVGLRPEAVRGEIEELVDDGLIQRRPLAGDAVYTLSDEDTPRRLIDDFIAACQDPYFRVRLVYHIVRGRCVLLLEGSQQQMTV